MPKDHFKPKELVLNESDPSYGIDGYYLAKLSISLYNNYFIIIVKKDDDFYYNNVKLSYKLIDHLWLLPNAASIPNDS